jgi:hypothetical protein
MNNPFIIFVSDDGFRIGWIHAGQPAIHSMPPAPSLKDQIRVIKQKLILAGYAGQSILLGLASSWCLSAIVDGKYINRSRRNSLGYLLEEHLPLSAEDMSIDFIPHDNNQALALCVEKLKLNPIIQALKNADIHVSHICPTAFLAASHAVEHFSQTLALLLHEDSSGFDFIELQNGKPLRWWWFADDQTSLRDRITAWSASHSNAPGLTLVGNAQTLNGPKNLNFLHLPQTQFEAALLNAANILGNVHTPWINLPSDAMDPNKRIHLKTRSAKFLAGAFATLLICLIIVTQWRGRKYASLASRFSNLQTLVFQTSMPNQSIPVSIQSRLNSERQRLASLGGQTSSSSNSPALHFTSALTHLQNILQFLPADIRFQINDLNIRLDSIVFDGQTKSHAQAEEIAASIRQSGTYEVDPPKTLSNNQGVNFTFTAKPVGSEKSSEIPLK